jgi:DNA-directed RNA polymerase specialized sigma24 family protein
MKEIQIIDGINKGELNAFHYLYTEYYSSLCVQAKSFTKTKDIAEEIVQDKFIKLWGQQDHLNIN